MFKSTDIKEKKKLSMMYPRLHQKSGRAPGMGDNEMIFTELKWVLKYQISKSI